MDRQRMIEEIQDKIADKTLSYWLVFKYQEERNDDLLHFCCIYDDFGDRKSISYMSRGGLCHDDYLDEVQSSMVLIWHPVSLPRVLSALGDEHYYDHWEILCWETEKRWEAFDVCPRKLLKEDWSDAYLQDQSDETIQALHSLLVR